MPYAYVMCVVSAMIEFFLPFPDFCKENIAKHLIWLMLKIAFFSFLSRLKSVRAVQIYYFLFVDFCYEIFAKKI